MCIVWWFLMLLLNISSARNNLFLQSAFNRANSCWVLLASLCLFHSPGIILFSFNMARILLGNSGPPLTIPWGNCKCLNYKCANLRDVKVCYLLESEISSPFWILDAVNRLIVDPDGSSKSIQMKIYHLIVLPHNISTAAPLFLDNKSVLYFKKYFDSLCLCLLRALNFMYAGVYKYLD